MWSRVGSFEAKLKLPSSGATHLDRIHTPKKKINIQLKIWQNLEKISRKNSFSFCLSISRYLCTRVIKMLPFFINFPCLFALHFSRNINNKSVATNRIITCKIIVSTWYITTYTNINNSMHLVQRCFFKYLLL